MIGNTMKKRYYGSKRALGVLAALAVAAGACGGDDPASTNVAAQQPAVDELSVEDAIEAACVGQELPEGDRFSITGYVAYSSWVELQPVDLEVLSSPDGERTVATTFTDGGDIVVGPFNDSYFNLTDAVLPALSAAGAPVYADVGPINGRLSAAVAPAADGTVRFITDCGALASSDAGFAHYADWFRQSGLEPTLETDAEIFGYVLSQPRPRTDAFEPYWDELEAEQEPSPEDWLERAPTERTLADDDVPADVAEAHGLFPNALVSVPEGWTASSYLICTGVEAGWGGFCSPLDSGPDITLSIQIPLDGSDIELWLWQGGGAIGEELAAVGRIDGQTLTQQLRDARVAARPTFDLTGLGDIESVIGKPPADVPIGTEILE